MDAVPTDKLVTTPVSLHLIRWSLRSPGAQKVRGRKARNPERLLLPLMREPAALPQKLFGRVSASGSSGHTWTKYPLSGVTIPVYLLASEMWKKPEKLPAWPDTSGQTQEPTGRHGENSKGNQRRDAWASRLLGADERQLESWLVDMDATAAIVMWLAATGWNVTGRI